MNLKLIRRVLRHLAFLAAIPTPRDRSGSHGAVMRREDAIARVRTAQHLILFVCASVVGLGYMAGGRPTDYREDMNEQVYKLCLLGATDAEIADFLDIAESTLNLWKLEHTKFSESIKRGKITADAEVANSLFKRANGYRYDEITYEKIGDGESITEVGEDEIVTIKQDKFKKKVVTKEVSPDVAAQNIWLKNRRGKVPADAQRWADKHETEITGKDGTPLIPPTIKLPDGTNLEI